MNIIFYDVHTNAVTGRIDIDGETVNGISGVAHVYLNSWKQAGRDVSDFADYYESWSNGYAKAEAEVATLEPTLAFTIDDDENVVELIRSDESGVSVRESGDWVPVNTDEDQPSIDDLEWLDVTEAAIEFWDTQSEEAGAVKRDDVLEYALDQE